MKSFTIYNAFFYAFFSKDFYKDVATNFKGVGFAFLFLLTIIEFIVLAAIPTKYLLEVDADALRGTSEEVVYDGEAEILRTAFADVVQQVPEVTIKDGVLSTNVPQPYYIYTDINGRSEAIAVIDTTGRFKTLEEAGVNVLITKDYAAIYEENKRSTRTYYFKDFESDEALIVNEELIWELIDMYFESMHAWVLLILFVFVILGMFLINIVAVLIYGIFGLIANAVAKTGLEYPEILRLTCYAVVPSFLISAVEQGIFYSNVLSTWIAFLIAAGYVIFAVLANRKT